MIYERIEKALNKAIQLHNGGLSANESVAKVARDEELNPETISRVVEAFNIAKTKAYVKVASDKTASFDIADKAAVIKAAYADEPSDNSKTASINVDPEDQWNAVITGVDPREENALIASTSEIPMDSRIKKAFHAIDEQNRLLDAKRQDVIEAREGFTSALKEASEVLQYTHEREKIAEYAAQIFSEHSGNQRAGRVLGLVAKCTGITGQEMSEKIATWTEYQASPFIDAFERMVESDQKYATAVNIFNNSLKEVIEGQSELRGLVARATDTTPEKHASDFLWGGPTKAQTASHKFAEFPEDLLKDVYVSLFEEKVAAPAANSLSVIEGLKIPNKVPKITGLLDTVNEPVDTIRGVQGITAPTKKEDELAGEGYKLRLQRNFKPKVKAKADVEVENIKRQHILQELMHDEIISQQDPQRIADAYNTMIDLAPKASMVKDVVRSVLRQGTAQTIDPHFANSLVELEHNILKTKNFVPGAPKK